MLASERTPGIEKCCELATDLLAAATHDSDAYLAVPLPHTGILKQGQPSKSPDDCNGLNLHVMLQHA